ncbi:MAG TPA: sterol desaturase family protein [Pyrinomonadaceae bacterium]|nr:sterol desaturase family protein [Pyrinomonadaceae bacterium]
MNVTGCGQLTPFYFYTPIALALGVAASLERPSVTKIIILLVSGFLSWGLIEYGLHRFVFHYSAKSAVGRKFIYAAHLSHHDNPKSKDDLFASLRLSVPIAAAYWLLAWGILGTWQPAAYLFIGLVAGYFSYEWLHLQAHHGKSRLPVLRYLKKYHLLHHYRTPGLRFGVTSPVFDLTFGTFRSAGDRRSAVKH